MIVIVSWAVFICVKIDLPISCIYSAYCGSLFIKTNFNRITNNRASNLHIVHLLRCNSVLYFKIEIWFREVLRIL